MRSPSDNQNECSGDTSYAVLCHRRAPLAAKASGGSQQRPPHAGVPRAGEEGVGRPPGPLTMSRTSADTICMQHVAVARAHTMVDSTLRAHTLKRRSCGRGGGAASARGGAADRQPGLPEGLRSESSAEDEARRASGAPGMGTRGRAAAGGVGAPGPSHAPPRAPLPPASPSSSLL